MLTEVQITNNLYHLKQKIDQIERELKDLSDSPEHVPELIDSSNFLRKNEFLVLIDQKKSELLSLYSDYSKSMELILSSLFEIQNELKIILHEQSSLLEPSKSKPKSKPKSRK